MFKSVTVSSEFGSYAPWAERVERVRGRAAFGQHIEELIRATNRERASYIQTYCGAKKIAREAAVAEIARRYQEFVEIFESHEKIVPA